MRSVLEEWRPVVDGTIESLLPRTVDDAYLTDFFGEATYAYDPSAIQRALADPIWDLLDRGGKRWRAVLFLLFVDAFGEDPEEYLEYAVIPEVLHNGTIIVDDVEEGIASGQNEFTIRVNDDWEATARLDASEREREIVTAGGKLSYTKQQAEEGGLGASPADD